MLTVNEIKRHLNKLEENNLITSWEAEFVSTSRGFFRVYCADGQSRWFWQSGVRNVKDIHKHLCISKED